MNTFNTTKDKQLWNSAGVINHYTVADDLQKPEKAIIDALREQLPFMRMLDLGIGGGRTTVHFAPLVHEYVGSDYAENMVEACIKRFPHAGVNTRFQVIDATNMAGVPDHYYDFILFSFNGLDCIAPEDRDKVFHEVRRVGKPGASFAFSSHNIQYLPTMYRPKLRRRWRSFLYQFYRIAMLLRYNGLPWQYVKQPYAVIRDGVEHFALTIHYINIGEQVRHLKRLGFRNVRVFSYKTGAEVPHDQFDTLKKNAWVYYLCEI